MTKETGRGWENKALRLPSAGLGPGETEGAAAPSGLGRGQRQGRRGWGRAGGVPGPAGTGGGWQGQTSAPKRPAQPARVGSGGCVCAGLGGCSWQSPPAPRPPAPALRSE